MAPGGSIQCAADVFCEQDGSGGCGFLPLCRYDAHSFGGGTFGAAIAGGCGGSICGADRFGAHADGGLGGGSAGGGVSRCCDSGAMEAEARKYREMLVEQAVEVDDAAMEAYLGGEEPDEATLIRCIRTGTLAGSFVPVLNGTAFKNKGCSHFWMRLLIFCLAAGCGCGQGAPPGSEPGSDDEDSREPHDDARFRHWPSRL